MTGVLKRRAETQTREEGHVTLEETEMGRMRPQARDAGSTRSWKRPKDPTLEPPEAAMTRLHLDFTLLASK